MKALKNFLNFDTEKFFSQKKLVFVKAAPWDDNGNIIGSKVTILIADDKTIYPNEGINNFGEQIVVKVRNISSNTFNKLSPLITEVSIDEVEKATVYGDYSQHLSLIGTLSVHKA